MPFWQQKQYYFILQSNAQYTLSVTQTVSSPQTSYIAIVRERAAQGHEHEQHIFRQLSTSTTMLGSKHKKSCKKKKTFCRLLPPCYSLALWGLNYFLYFSLLELVRYLWTYPPLYYYDQTLLESSGKTVTTAKSQPQKCSAFTILMPFQEVSHGSTYHDLEITIYRLQTAKKLSFTNQNFLKICFKSNQKCFTSFISINYFKLMQNQKFLNINCVKWIDSGSV